MKSLVVLFMLAAQPVLASSVEECVSVVNGDYVLSLNFGDSRLDQVTLRNLDHGGLGEGSAQAVQLVGSDYVVMVASTSSVGVQVGSHIQLRPAHEGYEAIVRSADGRASETFACR